MRKDRHRAGPSRKPLHESVRVPWRCVPSLGPRIAGSGPPVDSLGAALPWTGIVPSRQVGMAPDHGAFSVRCIRVSSNGPEGPLAAAREGCTVNPKRLQAFFSRPQALETPRLAPRLARFSGVFRGSIFFTFAALPAFSDSTEQLASPEETKNPTQVGYSSRPILTHVTAITGGAGHPSQTWPPVQALPQTESPTCSSVGVKRQGARGTAAWNRSAPGPGAGAVCLRPRTQRRIDHGSRARAGRPDRPPQ